MLEENPLFHAAAIRSAERVPSGLQSPAYWVLGSYTVLLTVGDMYATDDLGLILLLWQLNACFPPSRNVM